MMVNIRNNAGCNIYITYNDMSYTSLAVTVKPGGSSLDMQNLMNIMNSVYIPSGNQHQTIVVMSNQKANGSGSSSAAVQTALPVAQANVVQGACINVL